MEEDFRSPSDKPQQIAEPHKTRAAKVYAPRRPSPKEEKPCLSVTKGPSHLRQLCEFSGSFLIFPRSGVGNRTEQSA